VRLPRLTETKPRKSRKKRQKSDPDVLKARRAARIAARKRYRKAVLAGPERITEDRGPLFGTVSEQVVDVRPRGDTDEQVIVRRRRVSGKIKERKIIIKPV
jgi:hypothetical protein